MQLKVHHRTEYLYTKAVSHNSNELRLTPPNTDTQKCTSGTISVLPATRLRNYLDLNANRVHHFEILRPHNRLTIDSRATVKTKPQVDLNNLPYGFQHKELKHCTTLEACHPFLQNSDFVEITPTIWKQALDIQDDSTDVFQTCYAIMAHIFEHYDYDPNATNVHTHANEIIEKQLGVCQDFAHAMAALCRSIQIPTRYVSGYFYDATHDHSLRGAAASHAWVEVYIPPLGWIGLDPTNNKIVDETYIKLAVGRDYHAVAPVIGGYFGGDRSGLIVRVEVERIDAHLDISPAPA